MILGFIRAVLKILRSSRIVYLGGRLIRGIDLPCRRQCALDKVSRTVNSGRFNSAAILGGITPTPVDPRTTPLL